MYMYTCIMKFPMSRISSWGQDPFLQLGNPCSIFIYRRETTKTTCERCQTAVPSDQLQMGVCVCHRGTQKMARHSFLISLKKHLKKGADSSKHILKWLGFFMICLRDTKIAGFQLKPRRYWLALFTWVFIEQTLSGVV